MKTETKVAEVKPKIKKQVAITPVADEPSNFIQLAIKQNAPIEVMERLFALHEKVAAEKARGAYVVAISEFQAECPVIEKDKKVLGKDGKVRYQYAPLESIIAGIKKILAKNRLSYRWEVENRPDVIKATAIITHESGHQESSSFEIPIDKDGYMTAPQQYASALTYAKRYALCNVLGISTGEEDTDATTVNNEPDAKSPKAQIVLLLRKIGAEPADKSTQGYSEVVSRLTKLELVEKNYPEIVARLNVIASEQAQDEYANH
jgi:hypothetical protein